MATGARRLVLASLALAAGCNVVIPVELEWELPVAGPPGAVGGVVPIDLTTQELWAERERIEALTVDEVEIAVVEVGEHNRAETALVVLALRSSGAPEDGSGDLELLRLDALRLSAGERAIVQSVPGLVETLRATLDGDGRLGLVARLEAQGPVEALLRLGVRGSATVGTGVR